MQFLFFKSKGLDFSTFSGWFFKIKFVILDLTSSRIMLFSCAHSFWKHAANILFCYYINHNEIRIYRKRGQKSNMVEKNSYRWIECVSNVIGNNWTIPNQEVNKTKLMIIRYVKRMNLGWGNKMAKRDRRTNLSEKVPNCLACPFFCIWKWLKLSAMNLTFCFLVSTEADRKRKLV